MTETTLKRTELTAAAIRVLGRKTQQGRRLGIMALSTLTTAREAKWAIRDAYSAELRSALAAIMHLARIA